MTLRTFSPVHLVIMALVVLAGGGLAAWARSAPAAARGVRYGLAAFIASNDLVWYAYLVARGWVAPPAGLPLELCNVVLWVVVYALVTARPWALETSYYLGLVGSGMAVVTPDIGVPFPSFPAIEFFVTHGSVVAAVLFLVWSGALRPRPGSWWRMLVAVNVYAALVGLFDAWFGTNYMYLCRKPPSSTLLDLLGPWPWYLLGGEAIAAVLFWAMWLPLRRPVKVSASG